ncbi:MULTISPECIES: hypothetical protein [Haloprofundus]|uniref:hypothetical protein n=1 Tax=Haloprofundus TaxID=1911573 RepID=UPI000E44A098|nr:MULTISPECIES: hypothetical protein [Haloprofundus]QCJ48388.1 hypothetical protein FCF25_15165 [Haloprofundus sp. MHR1]
MDVPDDLKVAAVASACTVGLSLSLRYGLRVDANLFVRLLPLFVYFVYLFAKDALSETALGETTTWYVVTVAATLAAAVFYAI